VITRVPQVNEAFGGFLCLHLQKGSNRGGAAVLSMKKKMLARSSE
jgi:hypothetical protein